VSFRPLRDVLLIKLEQARDVTAGGIIRPLVRQNPSRLGTVLRAGPGRWWKDRHTGKWRYWAMEVQVGDRVVFAAALLDTKQGKSVAYVLNDDEALIRETDVLLVIPQGENIEIEL